MNQYVTGLTIKNLREEKKLTQLELAESLGVSDKAISKWETGKGYPDITLLEPLAKTLGLSISELLAGEPITNTNVSGNMLRSNFYVCPVCRNVFHSMGKASVHCHGIALDPLEAEPSDDNHKISIEKIENDYYVHIDHDMTKSHYISFIAALSPDRLQLVKLYPEGNAETRFYITDIKKIYYYCNRDGLFSLTVNKKLFDAI